MRGLLTLGCLWAATLGLCAQQAASRSEAYFAAYAPLAVAEMQTSRVPASITLAQGLLESGGGTSALATESNNHFGIKCNNGWTGRTHHAEDDDYHRGRLVASCFRAYDHPAESYSDHSLFLVSSPRYARLFELDVQDYRGWARGLEDCGYATSRTYAHQLIDIIERYELYRYDQGLEPLAANPELYASGAKPATPTHSPAGRRTARPATTAAPDIRSVNDVDFAVAADGETVESLASRVGRSVGELSRYNETISGRRSQLAAGQRVFLQPKRDNFRGRAKTHHVTHTEDLQAIADLYGLATDELRERNGIARGREPKTGERIVIRGRRRRSDAVAVVPSARRKDELAAVRGPQREAVARTRTEASPRSRVTASSAPVEIIELPPVAQPQQRIAEATSHPKPTTPEPRFVTVAAGDTLYQISRKSGVAVEEIRALNGLRTNTINVGQRLLLSR